MSSSAANRRRMTACFSLRQTGGHAGPPLHRQKKLTALHFRYPRKLRSVPSFFLSKSNPLRWVSIWLLYRKTYGPPCVAAREKAHLNPPVLLNREAVKNPVNRTHSSTETNNPSVSALGWSHLPLPKGGKPLRFASLSTSPVRGGMKGSPQFVQDDIFL